MVAIAGDTLCGPAPDAKFVPPPFGAVYHCMVEPVPAVPPLAIRSVELPGHIALGLAVTVVNAVDSVFMVTITLASTVVLQSPSRLT